MDTTCNFPAPVKFCPPGTICVGKAQHSGHDFGQMPQGYGGGGGVVTFGIDWEISKYKTIKIKLTVCL